MNVPTDAGVPTARAIKQTVEVPQHAEEVPQHADDAAEVPTADDAPKIRGVEKAGETLLYDEKIAKIETRLHAAECLMQEIIPMIQQEVVRPLNSRVDACKKDDEDMGEHLAGLVH